MSRHAQITQNNKFGISLQYLKYDVSDEADFLHADKHKGLLQIATMILMEIVRYSQNSQNSRFLMSLQYLKEEVRDEVNILHAERQSFLQVDFKTLAIKVYTNIIDSHSQLTKSKKVALSLQYHKMELGMELFFPMQIKVKVGVVIFYEVARHVQSTQKKLVIFLQFIRKEETAFVFYCEKNLHILRGSRVMFVVSQCY